MSDNKIGRREFLSYSAMLGAAGIVGLSSCSNNQEKVTPLREPGSYYVPELPDKAIEGRELKVGLVGCGGRGCGALQNLLDAADGIQVVALGDLFPDRIAVAREKLAERGISVPDGNCFLGFDAYKEVIDRVDMVILTTPPVFRPDQFKYAVEKGVHAFLEKPICVDPKGYRTCVAASKQAEAKGLCVVTGTQRHHQRHYVEAYQKISEGMIGQITSGNVYWNQSMLWYRERQKGWSDMEWMIRDWVNWKWLSGDHIVEQHVHNIDVFLWMSGLKPKSAHAMGSRERRITGDQYDQFSVDFNFGNGVHCHSMCRQIDGCDTVIREEVHGTRGYWRSDKHAIYDYAGNVLWEYDMEAEKAEHAQNNPYVLEHVDWVNHIRKGEMHVEAEETAVSCLAGIMGREAAYTGERTKWEDISASPLDYLPSKLALGPMDMTRNIPVPGKDKGRKGI